MNVKHEGQCHTVRSQGDLCTRPPKVSISELEDALLWTKDPVFDTEAFVSRETGEVIFTGGDDPMPVNVPKKDLRSKKKYLPTPDQNELIDARRLLFDFVEDTFPINWRPCRTTSTMLAPGAVPKRCFNAKASSTTGTITRTKH